VSPWVSTTKPHQREAVLAAMNQKRSIAIVVDATTQEKMDSPKPHVLPAIDCQKIKRFGNQCSEIQ